MCSTFLSSALLFSSTSIFMSCLSQQNLQLDATRHTPVADSNLIDLQCISDLLVGTVATNAVFLLNGRDLGQQLNTPLVMSEGIATFLITRDLEGNYSCQLPSSPRTSNQIPIIALPLPSSPIPVPPTVFAKVGTMAILNCSITPGHLLEQYSVVWRNGSQGEIYQLIPASNTVTNSRYSIDPTHFSLMIPDVQLLDSGSSYRCIVEVVDPRTEDVHFYHETRNISISLVVYKPPKITTPPASTVISANTTTVTFQCTAEGSSTPLITWKHKNATVAQGGKYLITSTEPFTTNKGRRGITSDLTVLNIEVRDTGIIECLAQAPLGQVSLPGDAKSVPLTVLGPFGTLTVFITTTRDAIFSLTYPVMPLHPVGLRFHYQEVGGAGRSRVDTPNTSFVNTAEINYIAFNPDIPYDRFRVEVSLVHGSVVGPGSDTTLTYDKTQPSQISKFILEAVLPSVLVPVVVLGMTIVVLIILLYCRYRGKDKARAEKERGNLELDKTYADGIREQIHTLNIKIKNECSIENVQKLTKLLENAIIASQKPRTRCDSATMEDDSENTHSPAKTLVNVAYMLVEKGLREGVIEGTTKDLEFLERSRLKVE